VVLGAASAAALITVVAAQAIGRLREPVWRETRRWCEPREANAMLELSPALLEEGEARPQLVAWEDGRASLPSFVLYEDGRWLRAPSWGAYVTGRISAAETADLAGRLHPSRLVVTPPVVRLVPDAFDLNVMTVCAAAGDHWGCLSVDGVPAPGAAEGVGVVEIPEGSLPAGFAAVHAALEAFDPGAGAPWSPSMMEIAVSLRGPIPPEMPHELVSPVAPWPSRLPQVPASTRAAGTWTLSLDDAARVEAHLAEHRTSVVRIGGRETVLRSAVPRLPGSAYLRALAAAFADVRYECSLRTER
jgi:hypothetical protein